MEGACPTLLSVEATTEGDLSDDKRPQNRFLTALPEEERVRLLAASERVEIAAHTLLWDVGAPLERCFLAEQGAVSLVVRLADGFESASGIIGPEGLIGLGALPRSGVRALNAYIVQLPFSGWRVRSTVLREAMQRSPEVLDRVLCFDQALKVQIAQTAACNQRHSAEQRLARWLLKVHDRSAGNELPLTQEFLSSMLGARRATVTLAARALSDAGAIRYRHGHLRIDDRQRLEQAACECYAVVSEHYRLLLAWPA
jgi:CRP-like cAMP-binding protein